MDLYATTSDNYFQTSPVSTSSPDGLLNRSEDVYSRNRRTSSNTGSSDPAATNGVFQEGSDWRMAVASGISVTWRRPPIVIDRLLSALFAAQPEDPLSWAHRAIWQLRTEELSGAIDDFENDEEHERHTSQRSNTSMLTAGTMGVIEEDLVVLPQMPLNRMSCRLKARNASRALNPVVGDRPLASPNPKLWESHSEKSMSGILSSDSKAPSQKRVGFTNNRTATPVLRTGKGVVRLRQHRTSELETRDNDFARYFGKSRPRKGFGLSHPEEPHQEQSRLSQELEKELTDEKCILSPVGRVRIVWDLVFFICLLFDMWAVPMELVFFPEDTLEHPEKLPIWFRVCCIIVLVFFIMDMIMNFFTGYVRRGGIVMKRSLIIRNYMSFWFWLDLVAILPDLIIIGFGHAISFVRVLRAFKFYKMLRALRLLRIVRLITTQGFANIIMMHFEMRTHHVFYIQSMQVCCLLIFLMHCHGSIWAALQPSEWKAAKNSKAFSNYLESFWSVSPALTLGGDLPATSNAQRFFAIIVSLERVAYIILCCKWLLWRASILSDDARRFCETEGALSYLKQHRVSPALQLKVFQNLHEVRHVQRLQQQFEKLASHSFPAQLRRLISDELWSDKLLSMDLIHHLARWDSAIVSELALLVREEAIASKVVVFSAGEASIKAYFIVTGCLGVNFHETEPNVPDYTPGMWVGEQAFVNAELRRNQTVVCKFWSQLMSLTAVDFHNCTHAFGLQDRYEELLRSQLWFGLCGRCGLLGDHFAHDCPLLMAVSQSTRSLTQLNAFSSGPKRSRHLSQRASGVDDGLDLHRFLCEHNLSRLKPIMTRYGISSLNDMKLSTVEQIRADPESQLSQAEAHLLSDVSIKEYRNRVRAACINILAKAGSANNHLVFISHYKREAGTEAALMSEELQKMINQDPGQAGHGLSNPVFLDSEDLRDLNQLKQHVRLSHNLLLLLTPGILSRPWCLVEIVTAIKAGVRVVPVEVNRKDFDFEFPDDDYFAATREGKALDKSSLQLLDEEGIDNETLEVCLRHVFMRIALPFSPHRTQAVRQAELRDILKGCSLRKELEDEMDGNFLGSAALSGSEQGLHQFGPTTEDDAR